MNEWEELTDEEKMMNLLEELQKENEELKKARPQTGDLVQTIREQEQTISALKQQISSLESSLIEGQKLNEDLMNLAENEKKIKEQNRLLLKDNANLQNEIERLKENHAQKMNIANQQIATLKQQTEDIADDYKKFARAIPSADNFLDAASAAKGAQKEIGMLHALNIINIAVALIFVFFVAFCGWHSYKANKNAQAAQEAAQAATNGLYNREGFAVLDGTKSSKAVIEAAKTKK